MEILGWIWICGKIIRLFTTLERFYERNYSNMTGIQKNILKYLFKFLPCKALILAIDYAMTMTPKNSTKFAETRKSPATYKYCNYYTVG